MYLFIYLLREYKESSPSRNSSSVSALDREGETRLMDIFLWYKLFRIVVSLKKYIF